MCSVEKEFEMAYSEKVPRKRKFTKYHDSDDECEEDSSDKDFEPAIKKPKAAKPRNKTEAAKEGPKSKIDKNNNDFKKQMSQVGLVLASFDQKPGFGNCLSSMLGEHAASSDAVAAFLCFIVERQKIWINKKKGMEVLTDNHIFSSKWFTNIYRELDRGTMYLRHQLNTDLKEFSMDKDNIDKNLVSKILFKSIIYRLINKVETFMDFGGVPDTDTFPKFMEFLHKKKSERCVIFTAAHQVMGFKNLLITLDYLVQEIGNLTSKLVIAAQNRSTKNCHAVLLKIPNVGGFLEWQILVDLLESKVLGLNTDNQWACLGPGAKNGLGRIFGKVTTREELDLTHLLRDMCRSKGPKSGFEMLNLEFSPFLQKDLSLKVRKSQKEIFMSSYLPKCKRKYHISANSFRGNYSFLKARVRKVFKGGNYSREETIVFLLLCKHL